MLALVDLWVMHDKVGVTAVTRRRRKLLTVREAMLHRMVQDMMDVMCLESLASVSSYPAVLRLQTLVDLISSSCCTFRTRMSQCVERKLDNRFCTALLQSLGPSISQ